MVSVTLIMVTFYLFGILYTKFQKSLTVSSYQLFFALCKTIRQYIDCISGNYFVTQRTLSRPRGLPRGARFHEIFFATSALLHLLLCWVNLLLPVSQSQNYQNYIFSTFHDLGAERCSCMVPLIWHTPIIVGSPPWGPGHGQFQPPNFVPNQPYESCFRDFHPHPEVSLLQVCNSLFMCSTSQQT